MKEREDGEFELILGNKQLFSVLFIVIVLLGVFFAMGFLAGRSTAPVAERRAQNAGPLRVDSAAAKPEPAPSTAEAAPAAAPVEVPAAASEKPPAKAEETAKKAEPAPPPPPPAPAPGEIGQPAPGRYLQVAATSRTDAESMRGLLGRENFHAALAPSSKPEYVRVLVGPFGSNEDLAAARERLRKLGIDKPFVVVYK
jgi:cell division septation protein DedD